MARKIDATDRFGALAAVAVLALLSFGVAFAQTPATLGSDSDQSADIDWTVLSAAELEELIGPVALYPDDLIAIVLPASTFPLQIVQASRYLEEAEANPELEPDPAWDESVVALLNYPEVLELLNDDLDWTWALGEAVVNQQADVLTAVQAFRDRAYAAGNLATDERQEIVAADDGTITIASSTCLITILRVSWCVIPGPSTTTIRTRIRFITIRIRPATRSARGCSGA
jgi:hypothetical protein